MLSQGVVHIGGFTVLRSMNSMDTKKDRTAFGRLVQKIRNLGFEIKIEGPASYTIGTYTGPEGGFGFLKDPTLKAGSNVQARGIVVRAKRKPTVE
jgi:hypothetical protein